MKKFFKKVIAYFAESVRDKKGGKVSSTRLSSYVILTMIQLSSLVFLTIDIINASQAWQNDEFYTIPTEHIVIFGMLLGHHLTLLGINKAAEVRHKKADVQQALGAINNQVNGEDGEEEEG